MTISTDTSSSDLAKLRLIHAAIKLFAYKGIDGVSLRMVNREAGAKNNSALHYHFGHKMGLITAVINYIQDWFEQTREGPLSALEQKSKTGNVSTKQIVDALIDPYVTLLESEDWGQDALCALARFEFDGDEVIHAVLNTSAGKAARRLRALLAKSCPELNRKQVNQRLHLCLFMAVQGFANYKNQHQTYMGDLKMSHQAMGALIKQFANAGIHKP